MNRARKDFMDASVKETRAVVNKSCYTPDELPMSIEYLADRLEFLPTLAQWQHAEWGHANPGDSVEARKARLQDSTNHDRIPLTVVAVEDGEVLGSASLVEHDIDTRLDLSPWLASVFVGPEHRRQGTGAELVRRIMREATKLKVPLLYLYTVHSEAFYAKLGWTLQEYTTYREQNVAIMTYIPIKPQS
jgi:N-acetylglutamate synthase-like GNAT family acetyltransferase